MSECLSLGCSTLSWDIVTLFISGNPQNPFRSYNCDSNFRFNLQLIQKGGPQQLNLSPPAPYSSAAQMRCPEPRHQTGNTAFGTLNPVHREKCPFPWRTTPIHNYISLFSPLLNGSLNHCAVVKLLILLPAPAHVRTGSKWHKPVCLIIRRAWASLAGQHLLPVPSCPWRALRDTNIAVSLVSHVGQTRWGRQVSFPIGH